jgi:hypothetical protein
MIMTARKQWRLPEPESVEPGRSWLRSDGSIDLYRLDPESLLTPEDCAAATTELDKAIARFGAQLKSFAAEYAATGVPTPKPLYHATHKLWTLAKTKRNIVQDRRGVLRREKNNTQRQAADIRSERRFVESARRMLTREQYLEIWEDANLLHNKLGQPSNNSLTE